MALLWNKPPVDFSKINVKAFFRSSNNTAGLGIILRDDEGEWLGGYGGNIGTAIPVTAELWAIYYGLQKSHNLGFKRIIVETDSVEAHELIMNPVESYAMSGLIDMIKALINKDWECSLNLVKVEANQAANFMAELGARSVYGLTAFDNPPRNLVPILDSDNVVEEIEVENDGDTPPAEGDESPQNV